MRLSLAAVLGALLLAPGCARTGVPPAPAAPDVSGRLSKADALTRVGCLDCLEEALGVYEEVRALANLRATDLEAAATGAIRTALLLELRQRELGMADDGYLRRAQELIGDRPDRE